MKIRNIIYIACGALVSLCSCSNWLDVIPKSQVKGEALFSSESGFRDALTGVYTLMNSTDLYGGNETMGLMDILAQNYSEIDSKLQDALKYDYDNTTVESRINSIWSGNYNVIANCNYILQDIDEKKSVFSKGMYETIKGEALAVRAYCLFDLLRAFAPSFKTGADKSGIPYVDHISKTPITQSTVREVLERLVTDLETARTLVKPFDPIGPEYSDYTEQGYDDEDFILNDGFWLYRKSRLNYYGMTALLARIYLYKEDTVKALECAKEVIDCGKFSLITEDDVKGNLSLAGSMDKKEYISSIYVYDMEKGRSDRYFSDNATDVSCYIGDTRRSDIFGTPGADIDWRNQKGFSIKDGESKEYLAKYKTVNRIPLLKLSEMYLIAAEASGDKSWLQTLRDHRGYINYPLGEDIDLADEIRQEYIKEFLGEGQLFYYYKRLNYTTLNYSSVPMTEKVYVLPMPDNEYEFGNIKNN